MLKNHGGFFFTQARKKDETTGRSLRDKEIISGIKKFLSCIATTYKLLKLPKVIARKKKKVITIFFNF